MNANADRGHVVAAFIATLYDDLMPKAREARDNVEIVIAHDAVKTRDLRNMHVHDRAIELRYLLRRVEETTNELLKEADIL